MDERFDVLAFGAHPDDLEVAMGGTAAKLSDKGSTALFVDLSDGEPTRYASRGARQAQAGDAAQILGVKRLTLTFQDRLITDTLQARLTIARLIRIHRPRYVFTTKGSGVHPDHRAVTEIVTNGVFYARLPKWDEVKGAESALDGTEPHEIERLFYARCRMEPAWHAFDFAVDISDWYERKRAAIAAYASVFEGDQARLLERYAAEDQYYGSLLGVRYAEPFQARGRYSSAIPRHSRKCHSVDRRAHFLPGFIFLVNRARVVTRTHFCSFGSYKQAEVLSHGLAHPRRCSCPVVGAAGVDLAAPRCAHVSGAAPTPVGGDGEPCGARRQRGATGVAPVVKELIHAIHSRN